MSVPYPVDPADVMSELTYDPHGPSGPTRPTAVNNVNSTPATLDAAVKPSMFSNCVTCGHTRDEHRKTFTRDRGGNRSLQTIDGCPLCGCEQYLSTWDDAEARFGRCYVHGHRFVPVQCDPDTIACINLHCGATWVRAAAHADQLAQAHAAGTAEGATAERERIVAYLQAEEDEHRRLARDAKERAEDGDEIAGIFAQENGRAAAVLKMHRLAIARAGTSGGDRAH